MVLFLKEIDDLFQAIENSSEYKKYAAISKVIEKDDKIRNLISEIKRLQQKSVKLEYSHHEEYKLINKEVEEKISQLYSFPLYQEYIKKMNELNDILAESTFQIEKYINSKI